MICSACGRELVRVRIDDFTYLCRECHTTFSTLTEGAIIPGATHCRRCHALIHRDELIDGLGSKCGCIAIVYRSMKKLLNDLGYPIIVETLI